MGRFIRKIKGGIRCLREHGIRYTAKLLMKEAAKRVLPESFILLNKIFRDNVLAGFRVYSELIETYGDDVTILGCAIAGTGDYYFCGMYLKTWLELNNISNYLFLTMKGSQQAVTELFPVYNDHTLIVTVRISQQLRDFRGFVGCENQNFIYLDHQYPFHSNHYHNIKTFNLMGYRDWNILDFYLACGFKLPQDAPTDTPVFNTNEDEIRAIFEKNQLTVGRTVLLSPSIHFQTAFGKYLQKT